MTDAPPSPRPLRRRPTMISLPTIPPVPAIDPPHPSSEIGVLLPLPNSSQETVTSPTPAPVVRDGTFTREQIDQQETQYPCTSPDPKYTPPPSPNSSQRTLFTHIPNHNSTSYPDVASGNIVVTYPCPHDKATCPCGPHEDASMARYGHYLFRTRGRLCFPARSHRSFVHTDIYNLPYCAVDPRAFSDEEFEQHWQTDPVDMILSTVRMGEEPLYQGAVYTISTSPYAMETVLSRGMSLILNGKKATHVRYFVMIHRHMNSDYSQVLITAITRQNKLVRYDHPDWPTFLLYVPNRFCKAPLPKELVPFYKQFIRQPLLPSTWWSILKSMGRKESSSDEEPKWDVEIIS